MKTKQESPPSSRAEALYPDAQCSLDYGKDYELLFSVRLAAQCTDARVNLVTPALFARYPTPEPLRRRTWMRWDNTSTPAASGVPSTGYRSLGPYAAGGVRRQSAGHYGAAAAAPRRGA